ncbi:MAG TPA: 2-oxoacid:acceptor oxidoreductase subunit alpha [Bacteroidales bacterium]|nr:2-oxoacid:acceptor oxidoreductase subunit alpha [Bacteroidales bacterium]
MEENQNQTRVKDDIVIRFSGDSGDGMQLTGTLFSETAAFTGNDLSTFPDFPAEIRAPQNTLAGVSGFQLHFGSTKIYNSGDLCDVLVAMNPASLKANLKWARKGATIIIDDDNFEDKAIQKAGYTSNPLTDGSLNSFVVIRVPMSRLTREAVKDLGMDPKSADRSKNMFALGILLYMFDKPLEHTYHFIEKKFGKKPLVVEANKRVLRAGYDYADTVEILHSRIHVPPAKMPKGRYRDITGNVATAWGLMAASEKSGRPLFLGSYPITPASEILIELSKHRNLGVKTFQAEDEIAGINSAIGASFAGSLGVTSTSGPGLSLKVEALGLAVMTELPLVVVDVQRAGPSTGMPTKPEQADLNLALFGRNGEAPLIVMAASSPADCFYTAFEASKLSLEHMTPAILLSDGYIGLGSELFRIPKMADLPEIKPPIAQPNTPYKPYARDPETLVRKWAIPGTEGLRHRIGGLEKTNIDGIVSTDPINHETMVKLRAEKVKRIENFIPLQEVYGESKGRLLVVSWGGTYGAVRNAIDKCRSEGLKIAHTHFKYLNPLPRNTAEILKAFDKVLVCELNAGQFVNYLRMNFPEVKYAQYNKIQGLPFMVNELYEAIKSNF